MQIAAADGYTIGLLDQMIGACVLLDLSLSPLRHIPNYVHIIITLIIENRRFPSFFIFTFDSCVSVAITKTNHSVGVYCITRESVTRIKTGNDNFKLNESEFVQLFHSVLEIKIYKK